MSTESQVLDRKSRNGGAWIKYNAFLQFRIGNTIIPLVIVPDRWPSSTCQARGLTNSKSLFGECLYRFCEPLSCGSLLLFSFVTVEGR